MIKEALFIDFHKSKLDANLAGFIYDLHLTDNIAN